MKVLSSAIKAPLRLHLAFQPLSTDFPWCEGRLKCQLLEEIIIRALPASTSDSEEEKQKLPDSTLFFFFFICFCIFIFFLLLPLQPLPVVSEKAFTLRIQHVAKSCHYSEHISLSHIHTVISKAA